MDKARLEQIADVACDMSLREDGCGCCEVCTDVAELITEVERLQAREDGWAKLLKSANNDVERLNEYINRLRGT